MSGSVFVAALVLTAGPESDCNANGVPDARDLQPAVRFAAATGYRVGLAPTSLAGGDLDGDGDVDLVTANRSSSDLSILRNVGDGAFAPSESLFVGAEPRVAIAGDLDGDGDLDLAVVQPFEVSILGNDGAASFAFLATVPVGSCPVAIAADDLDADGDLDLATANSLPESPLPDNVSVFLNLREGRFAPARNLAVGKNPSSITAADVTGDGAPDLVVTNAGTSDAPESTISILRNLGNGSFASATGYTIGSAPSAAAVGDLDGDRDADLVVAIRFPPSIRLVMNQGGGALVVGSTIPLWAVPAAATARDLDGDGDRDLAVALGPGSNDIAVLAGRGNGAFSAPLGVLVGQGPGALVAEDLDGDRDLDLASANLFHGQAFPGDVSVVSNAGGGVFMSAATYDVGRAVRAVASADLDADGDIDLVVANDDEAPGPGSLGGIVVFVNTGQGFFRAEPTNGVFREPTSLAAADLDDDGDFDLAVAAADSPDAAIHLNRGGGTFDLPRRFCLGAPSAAFQVADLDRDRDLDLACIFTGLSLAAVAFNDGRGGFQRTASFATGGNYAISLATADLNRDGGLDLVVAHFGSEVLEIFLNRGDGSFVSAESPRPGKHVSAVTAADLDGDANPDLVAGSFSDERLSLRRNLGDGTFGEPQTVVTGGRYAREVAATDVDRDGRLDLVASYSRSREVIVLRNAGDTGFDRAATIAVASDDEADGPQAVAISDLDGNGSSDLAVAAFQRGQLWVIPNRSSRAVSRDLDGDGIPDECQSRLFTRGDANDDGRLDLSDPVFTLGHLFSAGADPRCAKSADANDDGTLTIADPIFLLDRLFLSGDAPPPPHPACGRDPTEDELSCDVSRPCR